MNLYTFSDTFNVSNKIHVFDCDYFHALNVIISKGDYYEKYYYLEDVVYNAFSEDVIYTVFKETAHNPIYSPIPNQV